MFDAISCFISSDKIEVHGKTFLLSELSADILGITPDEYEKMRVAVKRIETLLQQDDSGETLFSLRVETGLLRSLLIKRKLFQTLTLPKIDAEDDFPEMIVNPINNDGQVFMRFDPVQVQYIPREIPGSPDNYAIYEYYHIEQLQSFLKVDFYRALMAGYVIRRCKNCKQFFLLTNGLHTEYCDRPIPGKPYRNCRNQGAKNSAKEKARNNPVIKSYTQAYNRIHPDYVRGRISLDERDMARKKIIDLRDEAISGKYHDAEVDALMRT